MKNTFGWRLTLLLVLLFLIPTVSVTENTYTPKLGIGPAKYAAIYTVAILGSALLINISGSNGIHAGASGAIWGLMTATLIYNIRNNLNPYYALRGIVINLIYSFSAGVSWQSHIGGGIAGLAIALVFFKGNKSDDCREEG